MRKWQSRDSSIIDLLSILGGGFCSPRQVAMPSGYDRRNLSKSELGTACPLYQRAFIVPVLERQRTL